MTTITGRLALHSKGFGFIEVDDRSSHFVPPPLLQGFYLNDICKARIDTDKQGRTVVRELSLVERSRDSLFGTAKRKGKAWRLVPDAEVATHELPLNKPRGTKLKSGDAVLASLNKDGEARVEAVYRDKEDTAGLDIARVISRHGLTREFPKGARAEVARSGRKPGKRAIQGRRDLRDLTTVTVDAPSTCDIDDAISVLPADDRGGIRLFVSIADVTEAVAEGSALDLSARARGTSVYLIDEVLPMFPRELSDAAFSLLPGKDRLTLTAELRIDPEGEVTSVDLYESVIRSRARVSYQQAYDLLRGREQHDDEDIDEAFSWFRTLLARLDLQRRRRGGFENPHVEPKVEDDAANQTHIFARSQNAAHRMIERFMVAANEAVARWLFDRGLTPLYRVHPAPTPENVRELVRVAENFGLAPGVSETLSPRALSAFVDQVRGMPWAPAFYSVLMRSLGKARYDPDPKGHFGLASAYYLHFTSPIRRYADVVVHRLVKAYLAGERDPDESGLVELSNQLLRREIASSRAERDHQKIVWARYMEERVGEEFDGNVTSARNFGLFVQLSDSRIEGLLPSENLGKGSPSYDATNMRLTIGKDSYEVGQALRVRVKRTDPALGQIEFELVAPARKRRRRRRRR